MPMTSPHGQMINEMTEHYFSRDNDTRAMHRRALTDHQLRYTIDVTQQFLSLMAEELAACGMRAYEVRELAMRMLERIFDPHREALTRLVQTHSQLTPAARDKLLSDFL